MSDRKDARKVAAEKVKKKVVKKKVVRKPVVDSMKAPRGNPRRPAPDPKPRKTSAEAKDWAATKAIFLPNELTGAKPKPEEKPKQAKRIVRVKPGTVARERLELRLGIGADDRKKWERQPDMTFEGVPKDVRERPGINRPRDYTRAERNQRDDPRDVERIPLEVARDSLGRPLRTASGDYYMGASGPDLLNILEKIGKATGGATYESAVAMGGLGTGPAGNVPLRSTPETKKQARIFLENVLGPEVTAAMSGEDFSKALGAVELMLLPASVFSPLGKTAGTALLRGATRAPTIARAARSGVGTAAARDALNTPILSLPKRTFRAGDAIVDMASARSRTGRLIERGYDAARGRVSKVGIGPVRIKDEVQKAGQVAQQRMKFDAKRQMVPAVRLKQIMGGLRKKLEYQYALRSLAMGIDPLEAAAYHAERAANATDPLVKANHTLHMDGYKRAAKYILRRGDELMLVDNAPVKLRTAWRLVPEVAEAREKMLLDMGLLTEEQIAARIQNPGRVFKGAKWTPEEEHAMNVIRSSPARQQLLDAMESQIPGRAAKAQIRVLDEQARAAWEDHNRELKRLQKVAQRNLAKMNEQIDEGLEVDEHAYAQWEDLLESVSDELEDGVPYDWFYRRLVDSGVGFPDDIKAELGTIDHMRVPGEGAAVPEVVFSDKKISANLRSKLNPRNLAKGKPANPRIWRNVNGKRIVVAGDVTPKQWAARALAVIPDAKKRDEYARWYEKFAPAFREVFGDATDEELGSIAEAVMRGFVVSQANASPSDGLHAVLRVMDALRRGVPVADDDFSVVGGAIRDAVRGLPIEKYVAAKLSDFGDSLAGKATRTWMGDNPIGGQPAAVDVHALRDRGFIDPKLRARLRDNFGLEEGTHYAVDGDGYATGPLYERTSEWYQEVADHLNKVKFDGRDDWIPAQAQALGWSVIQLLHGVEPEDLMFAINRNTRTISMEVTKGVSGIGADLTLDEARAVGQRLEGVISDLLEDEGVILRGNIRHVLGGYESDTNASLRLRGLGSKEQIERLVGRLARAFDQWEVWATREMETGAPTIVIDSPAFADEGVKARFFEALRKENKKFVGFASGQRNGNEALEIVMGSSTIPIAKREEWNDRYRSIVKKVADDVLGEDADYGYSFTHNQTIKGKHSGEGDVLRGSDAEGRGGASLDDPLVAKARAELERAVDDVRAARGADDAARGADGGVDAGRVHHAGERPGDAGAADLSSTGARRRTIHRERPWDTSIHPDVPRDRSFDHGIHKPDNGPRLGSYYSRVHTNPNTLAPTETWYHELAHFWQRHFAKQRRILEKTLGDDTEKWVEAWIEYVIDLYPQRKIPRQVRNAFDEMSEALLIEAERTGGVFVRGMLSDVPNARRVAEVFDSTLWYRELKGGAIRGAEDFAGGVAYTPFELGLPRDLRHPFASHRSYVRSMLGLFGGKTIKKGFVDPSVTKAFRGFLIENGFYKADVTNASFASLAKAVKMHSIRKARDFLLKASAEVPSRADDIPIYVNPDKSLPPELRKWFEIKSDIPDAIEDVGKHLDIDGLGNVDAEAFGDLAEKIFPNKIGGVNSEQVAASIIAGLTDPIENIRWVPAKLLYEGDMFANPKAFYTRGESWGALESVGESVGKGVDIINDFMKMSVLQLNPAYIPMNLMGNLALNLMQQGPFAIMNLPRAAMLSRELSPDLAATVDLFMGRGISHVATTKKMLTRPSGVFADITGALVDKIPRRAAFLHEAWAKGYRSADEIEYLLTADQAADDLYEVTQRANDAIIDYERLSPFERKIMARTFFIYPWIKGATRYTFRFPLEHPIQAQAFALLYERQQSAADEKLGDRPWYAEFNIPIGEVTRFGREYPLVVNPKQLLPFTTPLEFAQAFGGYVLGKEEWPALLDTLQQFYPALATSLTGWDAFEQKDVPTGAMTFLKEALDMPLVNAWQRFDQTDEEREEATSNRLYPRNETDDILRTAFGSLAPTPYNPEKGQHIAAGKKGKTPEQESREHWAEIEAVVPPEAAATVKEALRTKAEWKAVILDRARKEFGVDELDDVQETKALVEYAKTLHPNLNASGLIAATSPTTAGEIRGAMEKLLGWNLVSELTEKSNKIKKARAEGAVVSAG